ncbi:hypothetical protein AYI68_g6967 [Smittium mucronatum]|uniref:Uncharacterized protein n=1 Tax=Smittium mucronatum TaxID=133383 RepID=A0A1R0GQ20_9FUNG|nr:hypothetical protein AYI68_g6967 [Smittium mucronatum]
MEILWFLLLSLWKSSVISEESGYTEGSNTVSSNLSTSALRNLLPLPPAPCTNFSLVFVSKQCFHSFSETHSKFLEVVPPNFLTYAIVAVLSEYMSTDPPKISDGYKALSITNNFFSFICLFLSAEFHSP